MNRLSVLKLILAIIIVAITGLYTFIALSPSSLPQTPHPSKLPALSVTVVATPQKLVSSTTSAPIELTTFKYIEVIDSCGPYYEGDCVNMRSGPGEEYSSVLRLRNGVVLQVEGTVEVNGQTWYKIAPDKWIKYPERILGDQYVAARYVELFEDEGAQDLPIGSSATSTKKIIVDRSEEAIYAYDGEVLFMKEPISTGLELTPTPRGTFTIYRKTPSRYMQGPLPSISDQYFDLPGVPWNLYFTYEGATIHGAYWHDHFGKAWSHGCVNLDPQQAKKLYMWADLGTTVIVRD